jgi:hypothetical protein
MLPPADRITLRAKLGNRVERSRASIDMRVQTRADRSAQAIPNPTPRPDGSTGLDSTMR